MQISTFQPKLVPSYRPHRDERLGWLYYESSLLGCDAEILLYWEGSVGPLSVRLARVSVIESSKCITLLTSHTPVAFARKPRPVDDMDDILRWKATEFHLFMLYSGPFVLDGILHNTSLKHFMLLFVEMRILCSKPLSVLYCVMSYLLNLSRIRNTV